LTSLRSAKGRRARLGFERGAVWARLGEDCFSIHHDRGNNPGRVREFFMSMRQGRPVGEATVVPLSEREFAEWRRAQGHTVVEHAGHFWERIRPGFYQPVHWMVQMPAEQATRPTGLCWGFRTTIREADAEQANGSMPVHFLPEPQSYDLPRLASRQRNKVRNCLRKVEIVELLEPDLLYKQGHAIYMTAVRRSGYGRPLTVEQYRQMMGHHFHPRRGVILAGLIEGRLTGYVVSYAIEHTGYVEGVELGDEALEANVSLGLVFEWLQACRRSGVITQIVHGLHTPEDANLCHHKERMGFTVLHVPARHWFAPLTGRLVRLADRHRYYRLTGRV